MPIRKDDLEALGDMASFVGAYMQDFAKGAPADSARLFKNGGLNVRETLSKAIQSKEDESLKIIPDNVSLEQLPINPVFPITPAASVTDRNITLPQTQQNINTQKPNTIINHIEVSNITNQENNNIQQLEFSFLDKRVEGMGSVRDVITHFNSRLDVIEDQMKLIQNFVVDMRSFINSKRPKRKNES